MKELLKKIIPKSLLSFYHKILATLADYYYHHPSNKMIVIGVTGTKGKTTTCNILWHLLEQAGYKTGMASTANFRIHDAEWPNVQKMTMLGRFQLQKHLADMVRAGCQYAIIETSSEGIKQWRHWGIAYDIAFFLNLSPEHIEAHGSYENYKTAKGLLFASLNKKVKMDDGQEVKKVIFANSDDKEAEYFLNFPAAVKITYGTNSDANIVAKNIKSSENGITWEINSTGFYLKQIGSFNIYNVLPAVALGLYLGISLPVISEYLSQFPGMPGRMELVNAGQNFKVIVDYAYEPKSFESVLKTIQELYIKPELKNKIISVFGQCGGGRDTWRWPVMGELAAKYTACSIITIDEPYDDDPSKIADAIIVGFVKQGKKNNQDYFKILDRREAIQKAFSLAQKNDVVLLSGIGCSTRLAMAKGKKIPWNEKKVAEKLLQNTGKWGIMP